MFDAGASRPADLIQSHSWDFGDGTVQEGARVEHGYAEAGTYEVTLTVSSGDEVASDTATVEVSSAPVVPGLTATITTSGYPLAGAQLIANLASGQRISATSDTAGVATLHGLPDGEYTVFVSAAGYLPVAATATLIDGSGSLEVSMSGERQCWRGRQSSPMRDRRTRSTRPAPRTRMCSWPRSISL